jgi:hypothetical protein
VIEWSAREPPRLLSPNSCTKSRHSSSRVRKLPSFHFPSSLHQSDLGRRRRALSSEVVGGAAPFRGSATGSATLPAKPTDAQASRALQAHARRLDVALQDARGLAETVAGIVGNVSAAVLSSAEPGEVPTVVTVRARVALTLTGPCLYPPADTTCWSGCWVPPLPPQPSPPHHG